MSDPVIKSSEMPYPVLKSSQMSDPVTKSSQMSDHVTKSSEMSDPVPKGSEMLDHVPKRPETPDLVLEIFEMSDPVPKSPEMADPVPQSSEVPDPVPQSSEVPDPVPKSPEMAEPVPQSSEVPDPVPQSSEVPDPVPKSPEMVEPVPQSSEMSDRVPKKSKKPDPEPKISVKGAKYCCVVSCHNNTKKHRDLKFYAFSTKNLSQRELWIRAVDRVKPDGTSWEPKPSDRICSAHFASGQRSTIREHPDYVPSIFGTANGSRAKAEREVERFERRLRRRLMHVTNGAAAATDPASTSAAAAAVFQEPDPVPPKKPRKKRFVTASTQTCSSSPDPNEFRFEATFYRRAVAVQACIPTTLKPSGNYILGLTSTKGTNTISVPKKQFFEKLRYDDEFVAWTGLNKRLFMALLDKVGAEIKDSRHVSCKDRLLLCLIKLKTDLCFTALASVFATSRQTVSDIFHEVYPKLPKETVEMLKNVSK